MLARAGYPTRRSKSEVLLEQRTVSTISGARVHVLSYRLGLLGARGGLLGFIFFGMKCFNLCMLSRQQQPLFVRLVGNNLFLGVTKETGSSCTKIPGVRGEKVLLLVMYQKQAYFFPNLEKICWLLTLYMKSAWSTLLGVRKLWIDLQHAKLK